MNIEEQQRFMQITIDLSKFALEKQGGPFGAIVVKDGKIAGTSENNESRYTHAGAHAEVIAIRNACRNLKTLDLSGCQIFSSTEPCPMCLAAIYWAQISEIFYCNTETNILPFENPDEEYVHEPNIDQENQMINFDWFSNKNIHGFERSQLVYHQQDMSSIRE